MDDVSVPEIASSRRDIHLFLIILLMAFLGLLILYPASSFFSQSQYGDSTYVIKKQLLWFFWGIFGLFAAAIVPLNVLRRVSLPLMLFSVLLLLLVFVPGIGRSVASAGKSPFQRWIGIGGFVFQPSEFVKLSLVIYLADVLSDRIRWEKGFDLVPLLLPLSLVGISLFLIVLEPQFGTSICILAVVVTLVYISGFPFLQLVTVFLASLPLLALLVYFVPYRKERLLVWLDPYKYRLLGGYQLITAYRAFREGGIFGDDLAGGFAHRYLTYGHTDFILALFGEDYGLVGMVFLFSLYFLFLWRSYFVISRISDIFPFLLGSGVLVMLVFQTILNLLVVTGLIPTTGVPLPFLSYGGSSLVVSMVMGGLLLNVSRCSRDLKRAS